MGDPRRIFQSKDAEASALYAKRDASAEDVYPVLADANGNLLVSTSLNSVGDGRQTVTTAGTRVQLSTTSVPCSRVTICAETDNTNFIVVGGSAVVAALATRRGIPLNPGDTITLQVSNLNLVYLDSLVNTEGVTFLYEV